MITKHELKTIASLKHKKFREAERKIFVEGLRVLDEALVSGWTCEQLLMTHDFIARHGDEIGKPPFSEYPQQMISPQEFKTISDTQSPQGIGGVFKIQQPGEVIPTQSAVLYFDSINEPGNAGTLIRTAVWFGVRDIILSEGTVDVCNPKVIRSAAGSFFHARFYKDSRDYTLLRSLKNSGYQLLGADMQGTDFREVSYNANTLLIMGNEANGLSDSVHKLLTAHITIPRMGRGESLNVAVAGSILLSRFLK
jgi:TrmH family RNA methyltransferase